MYISFLLIGTNAIITQSVILREFFCIFEGNELLFGLFIALRLFSVAIGSLIGGFIKERYSLAFFFLGLCGLFSFFLCRILEFYEGSLFLLLVILIVFLPGFFAGLCFSWACERISYKSAALVYSIEAIGFFVGAIYFNLSILATNHLFILCLLLFVNSIALFRLKTKILCLLSFLIGVFLLITCNALDFWLIKKQFPWQVNWYKETPIGRVISCSYKEQKMIYLNNRVFFYQPEDVRFCEEFVHIPGGYVKNIQNILVINPTFGIINEIKKYKPKRIDTAIFEKTLKILDVFFIHEKDFFKFIDKKYNFYDLILINTSYPTTLSFNRFFIKEFFLLIKKSLKQEDSVVSFYMPNYLPFLSKELLYLQSSMYNTAKSVFKTVFIFVSDAYVIYICSQMPQKDFKLILPKGDYKFLTESYLQYGFLKSKTHLKQLQKTDILNNTKYYPNTLFWGIKYHCAQYFPSLKDFLDILEEFKFMWLFCILSLVSLIFFKRFRIFYIISSTGFFSMAVSLCILFFYQVKFGYLYHKIPILVGLFLSGLSVGSLIAYKRKIPFYLTESLLFLKGIIFLPLLKFEFLFYFFSLCFGILVGMEFSTAYKALLNFEKKAPILIYFVDLIGASLASVFFPFIFLKKFGFLNSLLILSFLKFLGILVSIWAR